MEWTAVKDKLPETELIPDVKIGNVASGYSPKGSFIIVMERRDGSRYVTSSSYDYRKKEFTGVTRNWNTGVTHWMKLPELPSQH